MQKSQDVIPVQAQRDTESSISNKLWIPAFDGMTTLMAL